MYLIKNNNNNNTENNTENNTISKNKTQSITISLQNSPKKNDYEKEKPIIIKTKNQEYLDQPKLLRNKKNNYKYKDGDRNYEYGPYRKHIKKNDYEKGRNNNENSIYNKKNNKKKRENNYEMNERYSENIEDFTSELNNPIQQEERTKHIKKI